MKHESKNANLALRQDYACKLYEYRVSGKYFSLGYFAKASCHQQEPSGLKVLLISQLPILSRCNPDFVVSFTGRSRVEDLPAAPVPWEVDFCKEH